MELRDLAQRAKDQLVEVTGPKSVTITGTFKGEDGWHVLAEMVEMKRIPDSTDVLGEYEVLLDENGSVVSFRRRRTRLRGEAVEHQES